MGEIELHPPVLLICAVFSRHAQAFDWARETLESAWGPVARESARFAHEETRYYEASMGPDLKKAFLAFERLVDPAELPGIKQQTNAWEIAYAQQAGHAEPRPLNLDPGYLTEAKLVLATTKDRDHRLYLGEGIFGEVTLHYRQRQWQPREWTYADYRRSDYHEFFDRCRDYLRGRDRSLPSE